MGEFVESELYELLGENPVSKWEPLWSQLYKLFGENPSSKWESLWS